MRWVGHAAGMENIRSAYKIMVRNHEGTVSLARRKRSWEGNIKMDLREIWREGVDWIQLAQSRDKWRALVNKVINLRVS